MASMTEIHQKLKKDNDYRISVNESNPYQMQGALLKADYPASFSHACDQVIFAEKIINPNSPLHWNN